MVQLLNEPPSALPYEVRLSLAANERHKLRWIGKVGGYAYASLFIYLPLLIWVGVRSWLWVALVYLLAALASTLSFWTSLRREPPAWGVLAVLLVSSLLFVSTSVFFGPLVLPPLLIAINTTVFTLYLPPSQRLLAALSGAACVLAPNVLWLAGVIPGYRIEAGTILLEASVLESNPVPLSILMVSAAAGAVVTGALAVTSVRDALARTEQQIFLYAWHLRELVPETARPTTDPTPARRASLPAEPPGVIRRPNR